MPLVYQELRRLAASYMQVERPGHTLQATALVHEAFLHIQSIETISWKSRAHFIAVSATIMRQVLVDQAREREAIKRGGGKATVSISDIENFAQQNEPNLVRLDDALTLFARDYPRQAKVVELKFFGGLTVDETVTVLSTDAGEGLSSRTVERDWRFARAWLQQALSA